MQVDSSIYFQSKLPDFTKSYYDGYDSGVTARQLLNQQQKEKNIQEAYKAGLVQNPDGSYKQDTKMTMKGLLDVGAGKEAMDFQKQQQQFQLEQQKLQQQKMLENYDMQARLLGSAKDQQTWNIAKQQAQKSGIDVSQIPDVYDEKFKNYLLGAALSAKDQIENQLKQQQFQFDERKFAADQADKKTQREIELKKLKNEVNSGDKLPIDKKKVVEGLATKNANKTAIKNQIDSVISQWDNLSEDQKVASGRQLLKTLNSTEGADAIGTEEAKRLGSKLEFAMGNLTNGNPIQFGRDLQGFKEQAMNTSKAIEDAVLSNQKIIDQNMGRSVESTSQVKPNQLKIPKPGDVQDGYVFLGGDPSVKKNWMKK